MVVDEIDKTIFDLVMNVPLLGKALAVVCAVLNLIFPGLGTIIASCADEDTVSKAQILVGLL